MVKINFESSERMLFHLFVAVCCAKIGTSIAEISLHQPFYYNKESYQ